MTAPKQTTAAPELPERLELRRDLGETPDFVHISDASFEAAPENYCAAEIACLYNAPQDSVRGKKAAALVHRYNTHQFLIDELKNLHDAAMLGECVKDAEGLECSAIIRARQVIAAATAQDAE